MHMHLSAIVNQQLRVDCHVSYCCMMDNTVSMTCSGMAVHVDITLDTGMSQAFCLVFGSHTQYKRSRMYSAGSFVLQN